MDEDEKDIYDNPDEEFYRSEVAFNRICHEKIASLKVPSHIQHADISYRPLFAKLMKSVISKAERIKLLVSFYRNFNECARKQHKQSKAPSKTIRFRWSIERQCDDRALPSPFWYLS